MLFLFAYSDFKNNVVLIFKNYIGSTFEKKISKWVVIFLKAFTYRSFFSSFCPSELDEESNGF